MEIRRIQRSFTKLATAAHGLSSCSHKANVHLLITRPRRHHTGIEVVHRSWWQGSKAEKHWGFHRNQGAAKTYREQKLWKTLGVQKAGGKSQREIKKLAVRQ